MNTKEKTSKHSKTSFSIKAKVTLLCTIFILIATSVNYLLLVNVSKSTITENTKTTMKDLADAYGKNVTNIVSKISDSASFLMQTDAIRAFIDSDGTESVAQTEEFISMYLNMNTSHEEINLVNADGKILYSSNNSKIGNDLSKETYFTNMMSSGTSTQSDVFFSDNSGEACVTFAIPFHGAPAEDLENMTGDMPENTTENNAENTKENNTDDITGDSTGTPMPQDFTGAITISVKVSEFSDELSSISVGGNESSYAYLLDSTGTIVYHPDSELIGKKLDIPEINNLISQTQSGTIPETDIINYIYNGVNKYASYSIDSNNHWILVITAEKAEVLASINKVTSKSLFISIIIIVILIIFSYLFAETIAKPIKKITKHINKTADLDFTTDPAFFKLTSRQDETGEMGRAIEKMRNILKTMIFQISEASTNLSQSADSLINMTQSVNDHASDNSATAEELSASMEETAATTDSICTSIDTIGIHSNDINQRTSACSDLSGKLIERSAALKLTTTGATENTQKIYEEVKEKTNTAIEQSKAVDKINHLTNVIKEIANQTSLLALNASIEAARAGDAGRGFSVVASEIGSLAEQSSKTVSGINDIVAEVHQSVDNLTHCLEQTLDFLENNVLPDYSEFLNASDQYHTNAQDMNGVLDSIHIGVNSLNTSLLQINNSITEINTMVGQASKGVEDVADKNTNIVSLTTNTYNMVKDSKGYAESLQAIVDKFKL